MLDFLTLQTTSTNANLVSLIYSVALAFILSTIIGFTYEKTFRGFSYSRNFLQAVILGSIVAATVMHAIGDSLARGLGMIGALAIIRFRTNFRDPRDIIFMFASLASGIASGVLAYAAAVVGTLGFCAAAFVLYHTPLGQYRFYDGMLRLSIDSTGSGKDLLEQALINNCSRFALITMRDMAQGTRLEYAYHIKLKKGKRYDDLVSAVNAIESAKGVNVSFHEATIEL